MEVYKFLPKVRGGAQRAEGSVVEGKLLYNCLKLSSTVVTDNFRTLKLSAEVVEDSFYTRIISYKVASDRFHTRNIS